METAEVPLWKQVSRQLIRQIDNGELKPGARLPGSRDLADQFGVNRHTVLRSIAHLEEKGLLRVEPGRRGTFVSESAIQYRLGAQTQFEESLREQNHVPAREILSLSEMVAPPGVAEALDLDENATVAVVSLLGRADDVPMNYGHHYFATGRTPNIAAAFREIADSEPAKLSIALALSRAGVKEFRRKNMRIRTRIPTVEEAHILQIPKTENVLELRVTNVDAKGVAVMCSSTCHAGSRVEFVVDF